MYLIIQEIWNHLAGRYANNSTALEHIAGESSVYSSDRLAGQRIAGIKEVQAAENY